MAALLVGEPAPDFELPDQAGRTISLAPLRGGWVVLYFYPRADTPGCATQACGVRDRYAEYESAGARVIGVAQAFPRVQPKQHDELLLAALGEAGAARVASPQDTST